MRHNCAGDTCRYCERRIAEIEYERQVADIDVPEYYDGT
jgi:hypothetical protein